MCFIVARSIPDADGWRTWRASVLVLLVGLAGVAGAQEVRSVGAGSAEIALAVTVDVGPIAVLGLGADAIVFDLQALGTEVAPTCVVGIGPDAVVGTALDGGDEVAPAGTSFSLRAWPTIEVAGGSLLTAYPPPPLSTGTGIVCYQTFELEVYANVSGWQLGVSRADRSESAPFPTAYVASVCDGEEASGLLPLADGGRRTLREDAEDDRCRTVLVALAVRIDAAGAGTAVTDLQYTLLSADSDFDRQ